MRTPSRRKAHVRKSVHGWLFILLALVMPCALASDKPLARADVPATIKAIDLQAKLTLNRRAVVFDPRPEFKPRALEAAQSDAKLNVAPRDRMDTYEEFRAELDRRRAWAETYLRDLTPAAPTQRPRQDLTQFQFRLESPEDIADPQRPWSNAGTWESVSVPDYRGPAGAWAGYYRTTFTLPVEFAPSDRRVVLHFEGVDYNGQVWLNGGLLGQHTGYFGSFEFDATARLKPGANTLLVRVGNQPPPSMGVGGSKIDGMCQPFWVRPTVHGSAAGLWRPVWLESRPAVHVTQVFVRPRKGLKDGEVWVEVQNLGDQHEDIAVELDFFPRNFEGEAITGVHLPRQVASQRDQAGPDTVNPAIPQQVEEIILRALPGRNTIKLPIEASGLRTWSPDHPWLYTARARLLDDKGTTYDCADQMFGWRFFEYDAESQPYKGWPTLNGERIILRMMGEWSNFVVALLKGDREQMLEDMLIFKASNHNGMRFTMRGAAPREVFELADQLGVMIQSDMPAHGRIRNETAAEYARQAGEMARQIRPHASATMVSYMNEQRADEFLAKGGAWANMLHVDELNLLMKQCDLAVRMQAPDMAAKWIEGANSSMYIWHGDVPEGIQDVHYYNATFTPRYGYELLQGAIKWPKPGWVTSVGEFGAEGLDDWQSIQETWTDEYKPASLDAPWDYSTSKLESALQRLYAMYFDHQDTAREWIEASQDYQVWANVPLQQALRRRSDRVVSTGPHYLIDGNAPALGYSLVTYARRPKKAFYELTDSLTPLAVNIYLPKTRYISGAPLVNEFWVLNDTHAAPEGARLAWQVLDGERVLFQGSTAADVQPMKSVYQGHCAWVTPLVETRTTLSLRLALLAKDGAVLHDHTVPFEVFPALRPLSPALPMYQVGGLFDAKVLGDLGLSDIALEEAAVIVVSDQRQFAAERGAIIERVKQGAGLLLLNADYGAQEATLDLFSPTLSPEHPTWDLGELQITRERDPMMNTMTRQFVSRKTGHPLVATYQPMDFRDWYYPARNNARQLLAIGYNQQEGGKPILVTREQSKTLPRTMIDAAVEYGLGDGRVIACALNLEDGALHDNPIARDFVQRMVGYLGRR